MFTMSKFNLFDYMGDILNHFYCINDLEHCCALESLIGGNYKTEAQKIFLMRFSRVWELVEERESKKRRKA